MSLELILKDIDDQYVRENFRRIARFIDQQTILGGNWQIYTLDIDKAVVNYQFRHNLTFIPRHIIPLSVVGNKKLDFRHDLFTREHIVLSTEGATCITFLAGRYNDEACEQTGLAAVPLYDPPNITVNPTATSLSELYNTDTTTAVRDLVKINGADTVTKIGGNALANIPNGIFGIVLSKPTTTTAYIMFLGKVSGYSGFTTGAALYISTSGGLTHTAPSTGVVQQVGFATDANTIHVNLKQPIKRFS